MGVDLVVVDLVGVDLVGVNLVGRPSGRTSLSGEVAQNHRVDGLHSGEVAERWIDK